MNDTIREYCSSAGDEANDVFERICAKKERIGIDLEVQFMQELIKARKEKGLTQNFLSPLLSGLRMVLIPHHWERSQKFLLQL